MIKTLIVDDEQHAIDEIANHLNAYKNYRICGTAKTLRQAIELTKVFKPDLVFLDIVLGAKTGFDYLNAFLPNIDFDIVFTTGYNNYAVKAFEYSALHYLLKPITTEKLKEALTRMNMKVSETERLQRLQSLEHNIEVTNGYKWIHIATMEKKYRIYSKDILLIKSDSNYAHIHLVDKTRITTSKTLKYYTGLLQDSHFYKVHKSYLINTEHIKTYNRKKGELIMLDNTLVTVAERRRNEFIKIFFSR